MNGIQIVACSIPWGSLTNGETLVGIVVDYEVDQIRAPIDGFPLEKGLETVNVGCALLPGPDAGRVTSVIDRCVSHSPGLNAHLRV